MSIPIDKFGKDHFSTFGYIACVVVGQAGVPDRAKMRCDRDRHPRLAGPQSSTSPKKYPTHLRDGKEQRNHDDWDCADDLVAAELIEWGGTGINPIFSLTPFGWDVLRQITEHKNGGGNFADFAPVQSGRAE